jgi:hypothetical protein
MKYLITICIAGSIALTACNDRTDNQPESEKYRDSGNHQRDGGYSPDTSTSRDTSYYQRMPNKVNDSANQ